MIECLILGSAGWGSKIDKLTAFKMLDKFIAYGGRQIDGATNYPINGIAKDFGLANRYLSEWISLNSGVDLNVFIKLGSINNSGGPESDLSGKTMRQNADMLQQDFGLSLGGIGVHWDNRGIDQVEQMYETIQQMNRFYDNGFRIGMSGVREANTYLQLAPNLQNVWEIQVKENVDDQTIRDNYMKVFPKASYVVYGINSSKIESRTLKPGVLKREFQDEKQIASYDLYFLSIKKILECNEVKKVIVGPRTLEQLDSILVRMKSYNSDFV
jgi:aryl-alcohol dehydrogenase-like predicted oxidoreductase